MPELLNLSELLHTPGMRIPCELNVPCTEELELECASPVTGSLVFTNTGNLLVILGSARVDLKTRCPRCLSEVTGRVEAPVDEGFIIDDGQVKARADDEDAGMADPTLRALFDAHMLNVTELVRQAVVLSGPPEPLCQADCRGLCPICGANLNEAECGCEPETQSPFAVLASLYEDTDKASDEGS
jgi:uncharacterized protein